MGDQATVLKFTIEQKLRVLTDLRESVKADLKVAKRELLAARARKNYLAMQLDKIDEQIMRALGGRF